MGLFDSLKNAVQSELNHATKQAVNNAVHNAANNITNATKSHSTTNTSNINNGGSIGKGKRKEESFTFAKLPTTVDELKALPEASLDSAFKTTALAIAVLCNYGNNKEETFAMLDVLRGPAPLNPSEKNFIFDRLEGKLYKPFSFFEGATPENSYKPNEPFKITVIENPYSFDEENWGILYVKSSGADAERPVKLRKKPSTGQWFLNDIQCLADMRIPVAEDPWA